ncbi:cation diffusion facilitator family transporter [Bacteroidota bacterium]
MFKSTFADNLLAMIHDLKKRKSPAPIVWFSIGASILTILLKAAAYYVTDSVGFLSDAMESFINLIAGVTAFILLKVAFRPPDKEHPFGHDKAEYFSSLIEGSLIIIAAIGIGYTAINRILHPKPLEELNLGMIFSVIATIINLVTARILLFFGHKYKSITLEADARHLMTDVWTTVGILVGILIVKFTGFNLIDPIIAIIVSLGIVYTGMKLLIRSTEGLMDTALPEKDLVILKNILDKYKVQGIDYHAIYTRKVSSRSFISFHLLFPSEWTIYKCHEIAKEVEKEINNLYSFSDIFIHLEPFNDPEAYDDFLEGN